MRDAGMRGVTEAGRALQVLVVASFRRKIMRQIVPASGMQRWAGMRGRGAGGAQEYGNTGASDVADARTPFDCGGRGGRAFRRRS
ncbi:hypothetical protein DM806_20710 [Sphingobium lactosutens]|nr:hypothetical protein [Sphingobium lactosutens]